MLLVHGPEFLTRKMCCNKNYVLLSHVSPTQIVVTLNWLIIIIIFLLSSFRISFVEIFFVGATCSHGDEHFCGDRLGFIALWTSREVQMFQINILPPSSGLNMYIRLVVVIVVHWPGKNFILINLIGIDLFQHNEVLLVLSYTFMTTIKYFWDTEYPLSNFEFFFLVGPEICCFYFILMLKTVFP